MARPTSQQISDAIARVHKARREVLPASDEFLDAPIDPRLSNADIPARTDLNELIKDEQFKVIYVPESVVLDGAVTSVHQLRKRHNSVKILAGELILVARISGL